MVTGIQSGSDSTPTTPSRSKPRVGVILRQTAAGQKSSHDIVELQAVKERYRQQCQQLKSLKKALQQRHAAMLQTEKAQSEVRQFALL